MTIDSTFYPLALMMILAGLGAGFIAGMLGVGGGILLVPVLEFALRAVGFPSEACMHVAVATSLATIIPTAISSTRAHHARGAIDWPLVRAWSPGIVLGAVLGAVLASQVQGRVLTGLFGGIALLVAAKMVAPKDHWQIRATPPFGIVGNLLGAMIGGVSAMMGIGGGTLGVPLIHLLGQSVHRAVATSSCFGLLIGIPGTVGYLLATPTQPLPSWHIGYVSVLGFILIAPASFYTAPAGAKLAHSLQRRHLSQVFGLFLSVVAARMLYRSVSG